MTAVPTPSPAHQLTTLYSPRVRAEALRYAQRQYQVLLEKLAGAQRPPNAWYRAGFHDGFVAGFCFALARYRMDELLDATHALRDQQHSLHATVERLRTKVVQIAGSLRADAPAPLAPDAAAPAAAPPNAASPLTIRIDGAGPLDAAQPPLDDDADTQLEPPPAGAETADR